jgi:hypothetical protein
VPETGREQHDERHDPDEDPDLERPAPEPPWIQLVGKRQNVVMPRFHHLWIVDVELELRNPAPQNRPGETLAADGDRSCAGRIYDALSRYATEESAPYPAEVVREDDRWLEVSFPVWAATRFAALAAGAAILAEACAHAGADTGVVRLAIGESAEELREYRGRVHEMEATSS